MASSSQQSTTSMLMLSSPTYRFDPIMNPTRHLINVADVGPSDGRGPCANPRCMILGGMAPSTHKCPDCGMNIHVPCGKETGNLAFVLCPLCERKRNNSQSVSVHLPTAASTVLTTTTTVASAPTAATATATTTAPPPPKTTTAERRNARVEHQKKVFESQYKDAASSIEIVHQGGIEVPCGAGGKTSRLISICGIETKKIENHALQKFCTIAGMRGWTRLTKKELCDAIVKFREDGATIAAAVAGPRVATNTAVISGSPAQKLNGAIRVINCMFSTQVLLLYARFGETLGRDEMTAGKRKNQVMYETILQLYNSDDLADDHIAQIHHDFEGSHGLSALKKDCGILESWGVVESVVKRIHTDFNKIKTQWKRSGENRDLPDVLEGIAKDLEAE